MSHSIFPPVHFANMRGTSRPSTPPSDPKSLPGTRGSSPTKSPHKSPGRSFSLSGRPRFTGQIVVSQLPHRTVTSSSPPQQSTAPLRHSVSDESIQIARSSRASSEPPPPPLKDQPSDPLFQAARAKLSSMDQEAMAKLRSTLSQHGDSDNSSPASPRFPTVSSSSTSRVRSGMSGLNKQMFEPTPENEAGPSSQRQSTAEVAPTDQVIAILGHAGVGKSTVIRRALKAWGVSNPVLFTTSEGHPISSCHSIIQPGGKLKHPWNVEFLEMDIGALHQGDSFWPKGLPPVSGAVVCYDATQKRSTVGIAKLLHRLSIESIPCVLLACKSDPDAVLQVPPDHGDGIGRPYNVGLIEVTTMTSEGKSKMRNALRWLLFKLEQRHRRRRRSNSPVKSPSHLAALPSVDRDSDTSSGAERIMWGRMAAAESDTHSSSSSLQWMMKGPLHGNEDVGHSEVGEKESKDPRLSEYAQPAEAVDIWMSEKELCNRFFTATVSARDESLLTAFLLTYRRFMQPSRLMSMFHDRFQEVEGYSVSRDIRHWALQRLAGALIDWCKMYPGDLAGQDTQATFRQILDLVLPHMFMAHLTADLVLVEQGLSDVVDVDQSWSRQETPDVPPLSAASELMLGTDVLYDFESSLGKSDPGADTPPTTTAASTSTKSTTSLHVEENYRVRSNSVSKVLQESIEELQTDETGFSRWSSSFFYVIAADPAALAFELTRMQWELFSAIRPRDVFRHDFGHEKDTPISKAVAFFNHLSRWTTTLILAHPKAKHRAKMYERLMLIAHQLRRLNNYDSLYAIISGMQETSVHRLTQTQALIYPSASKREFAAHLALMDPRSGYVHYRRAIQADLKQGKSAIPLLTTILGMINRLQSTRPEDVRKDGDIQWDKFMRFGEILSVISDCQAQGAIVAGKPAEAFRRAIHGIPVITSEDALFERSKMLEPIGGGNNAVNRAGNVFKRFVNMGLGDPTTTL